MGANIYWLPVEPGISLEISTPSTFIEIMEKVFGRFPCSLGMRDLEKLRGMAAIEPEMFEQLLNAVEKHKTIKLWAEW